MEKYYPSLIDLFIKLNLCVNGKHDFTFLNMGVGVVTFTLKNKSFVPVRQVYHIRLSWKNPTAFGMREENNRWALGLMSTENIIRKEEAIIIMDEFRASLLELVGTEKSL
jgi:hypothetical protein